MSWKKYLSPLLLLSCLTLFAACGSHEDDGDGKDISCGVDELLCEGICVAAQVDPSHCGACGNVCDEGERCEAGACVVACGEGRKNCGGSCVNLGENQHHCGGCNQPCEAGSFCVDGSCQVDCPEGLYACSEGCTDVRSDPAHCGGCDRPCSDQPGSVGGSCVDGLCVLECAPGFGDCDGDPSNGCEVDLAEESEHCGACGTMCRDDQVCEGGSCVCPENTILCGGRCVDPQTDSNFCGDCETNCETLAAQLGEEGASCVAGACVFVCEAGWGDCSSQLGCETHLERDRNNCGACGVQCEGAELCIDGSCSCEGGGVERCDGVCVDVFGESEHCGGCGATCITDNVRSASCVLGTCQPKCETGWGNCGEDTSVCETNLKEDSENCGECGKSCEGGKICSEGDCVCPPGQADCGGGICQDVLEDLNNCGACTNKCMDGAVHFSNVSCEAGSCTYLCQPGYESCDPAQKGCETHIAADVANCGACGEACELEGALCDEGVCSCGELSACSTACVNLDLDDQNCGSCGKACSGGSYCEAGECICGALTDCDGVCADLQSDAAHCGSCGEACAEGEVCEEGTCYVPCTPEETRCEGVCVKLAKDTAHCGACGNDCEAHVNVASAACQDSCIYFCEDGFADCDEEIFGCETEILANNANCGACGTVCGEDSTCVEGDCVCEEAGQVSCDGACYDLNSDPSFCGSSCEDARTCGAGCNDGSCFDVIAMADTMSRHTCAIISGGELTCWGLNTSGQLGDGTTEQRMRPVKVQGLPGPVKQISLGGTTASHSCALLEDGRVACWGLNNNGQLGDGSNTNSSSPVLVVDADTDQVLSGVQAITTTFSSSCALLNSGEVKCWGAGTSGRLGRGDTVASNKAVFVLNSQGDAPLAPVEQIHGSADHLCALRYGDVYCWGANGTGQLGTGDTVSRSLPVLVSGLAASAQQVVTTSNVSCALLAAPHAGKVQCWAHDVHGREIGWGQNSKTGSHMPAFVKTGTYSRGDDLEGAVQLSAGALHVCSLLNSGEVWCWGGTGPRTGKTSNFATPIIREDDSPISDVASIHSGSQHACALYHGGKVECWGAAHNQYRHGQLGNGDTTPRTYPTPVDWSQFTP